MYFILTGQNELPALKRHMKVQFSHDDFELLKFQIYISFINIFQNYNLINILLRHGGKLNRDLNTDRYQY